ncbi:hypothetical protein Thiowin_01890 [Thiorhodovibrio winogradskyi]|uniref:VWA-like domain-containing protein n=1 Tax=Thiorhodovibrio winogradskyi TaxID=77007 RepID=A0ABZ0S7F5_9GAMM|nr:VWA-like domain-containing protein [Thiorhodovibrio winogradskyi]
MDPRARMGQVLERWFITEPLLFAVFSDHRMLIEPIATIRVGEGRIGYNPAFIDGLDASQLDAVMRLEAVRILLKHPYRRRQHPPHISYQASNLALHEHLHLPLPLPSAFTTFGHHDYDQQFHEFYHARLLEQALPAWGASAPDSPSDPLSDRLADPPSESGGQPQPGGQPGKAAGADADAPAPIADRVPPSLTDYGRSPCIGEENTRPWGEDELMSERIDEHVADAELRQSWGNLPGAIRQRVIANRQPKLDYRAVLRQFRLSVLSTKRRLTRMKPSRRYGFLYQGSRYDFRTRLLVAVDVSGSMSDEDIARGFSLINRFFHYGIERVDAIAFDTQVQGPALTLKHARRTFAIRGRGGTDFQAVIDYLDSHPGYDGAIIFTDGYAPTPKPPRDRRSRLLWIFINESAYHQARGLKTLGTTLFLRPDSARIRSPSSARLSKP